MKVLVCGSRNWTDPEPIRRELAALPWHIEYDVDYNALDEYRRLHGMDPDPKNVVKERSVRDAVIIHGDARGADRLAGQIAREMGFEVIAVPAEWEKYGKAAGPIRNQKMLEMKPDLVIAFHEDLSKSRGTKDMIDRSLKSGIRCIVVPKEGK